MRPRLRLIIEPRDVWVGVFVDTAKRRVYLLPAPCVGVVIEW